MVVSPVELALMILPAHVDCHVIVSIWDHGSHEFFIDIRVIKILGTLEDGFTLLSVVGEH